MTVALATWVWGIVGILIFLALGVLAAVALGLVELPGSLVRPAGQTAVPDEVPDRTAAEAAEEAEELRDR